MDDTDKGYLATEQMFALVGRAITAWSFVELSLCNIFTICVTPCPVRRDPEGGIVSMLDSTVPTNIFYSVENFRGKLGLVDAALQGRVSDHEQWALDVRNDWAKLHDKTRRLSLKRNKLAHWTVVPAFQDDDQFREARLMPPYGSPAWWRETGLRPPGNFLRPMQLVHLERAFKLIDEKLYHFYKALAQRQELTDKYDQLTVRQIRSHDRLDPTRGARIRRALASPE